MVWFMYSLDEIASDLPFGEKNIQAFVVSAAVTPIIRGSMQECKMGLDARKPVFGGLRTT